MNNFTTIKQVSDPIIHISNHFTNICNQLYRHWGSRIQQYIRACQMEYCYIQDELTRGPVYLYAKNITKMRNLIDEMSGALVNPPFNI